MTDQSRTRTLKWLNLYRWWRQLVTAVAAIAFVGCVSFDGTTEEISFRGGGDIQLQGVLVLPEDASPPYPAIVLLHGAEKSTSDNPNKKMTANIFLERGIAVLSYDKRGVGDSEGDYESTMYSQLVDDAVAAVEFLRQRPDIDNANIGVHGVSESGWITPEVNDRLGGVAYVINKVGSPLSVRETVAWERYNELLDEGISEQSASEQVEVYRAIWDYRVAPSEDKWIAVHQQLSEWAEREDSQLPTELKREVSAEYLANIRYDPTPFLERLETPMLYIYGSEDINIPTEWSVVRLNELSAGGKPVTSYVFEEAGHEIGGLKPYPPFYAFEEGYEALIGSFAVENIKRE